ncbi:MAG: hypothetical protein HN348_30545 [Proteobacteria bacterium]|nr:hypothetical protein [Pseudomonadota bacterium]
MGKYLLLLPVLLVVATIGLGISHAEEPPMTPRTDCGGFNFVDLNNDGICDYAAEGGYGQNFVDLNEDGICDNASRGCGRRLGKANLVDDNNNGICDFLEADDTVPAGVRGRGQGRGLGRGLGRGNNGRGLGRGAR